MKKISDAMKKDFLLLLGDLTPREEVILQTRIFEERARTHTDIANEFGVSAPTISHQEESLRRRISKLIWKERNNAASAIGQEYQRLVGEAIKERDHVSDDKDTPLYDIDYVGIAQSMVSNPRKGLSR